MLQNGSIPAATDCWAAEHTAIIVCVCEIIVCVCVNDRVLGR
jgi:hypothetical protein